MLIETPYKAQDAVTLKLSSSEEIIARFVAEDDNTITVVKPMALMMAQQGPGLGPFLFTVNPDTEIKLNKNNVLFIVKSDPEMSKQYIESTTGIAVV
jgi:hypothetical protein